MIFSNKTEDELIITCDCGCGYGMHWSAGVWDDEGEQYCLMLVEASWYSMQESRLKSYLKRLWKTIRGKEYCLTELIMKKAEVDEFAVFLNKLTHKRCKEGEL